MVSTPDGQTVPGPVQRRMLANRYAIHDVLGRGGMGVVWGAEDTVIGRQVAIKELKLPEGIPDAERQVYEERVLREARTTGRLNDPGVVTVHDVLTDAGSTYIVMELIEAPTLADVIRRHGPLPPEQVLAIAETALSALDSAHAAGVVHRDVKPSNIMVAGNGRVKLTDFGIAQALDDPRLTTSGALIGSPAFMAPERIEHAAATPASDLWSLGATLFNAVEGYPAFERPSTAATMHAIMNGEVPQLQRAGGVLATIIGGLLVAAPEARLNATGVRALLGAARGATPPGGFTAAPQGVPGTLVYGAAPPTMLAAQPNQRPAPGRGKRFAVLATVAVLAAAVGLGGGFLLFHQSSTGTVANTLSYGPGGQLPRFALGSTINGCLSKVPVEGDSFTESQTVSCDESHAAEIYADAPTFGSTDYSYPGKESLGQFADSTCELLFNTNLIDVPGKDVTLNYVAVYPNQNSWNSSSSSAGGRNIFCVVSGSDGKPLTRSVSSAN